MPSTRIASWCCSDTKYQCCIICSHFGHNPSGPARFSIRMYHATSGVCFDLSYLAQQRFLSFPRKCETARSISCWVIMGRFGMTLSCLPLCGSRSGNVAVMLRTSQSRQEGKLYHTRSECSKADSSSSQLLCHCIRACDT